MGNIIKGRELMVFVKESTSSTYHSVAYATNHTLDISADSIDASNKDYGAWGKNLTSKLSWTMSTENLFSTSTSNDTQYVYDTLFQKMVACEELDLLFALATDGSGTTSSGLDEITATDWVPGSPFYKGKAVITSLSLNASDGDMASFTCEFQGSGAITKVSSITSGGKA